MRELSYDKAIKRNVCFKNTCTKNSSSTWNLLQSKKTATSFFKESHNLFRYLLLLMSACPQNVHLYIFFKAQHLRFTGELSVIKPGKHGSYHRRVYSSLRDKI